MAGCTGLCLHYSVLMVAVSTRLAPTGPPFGFQIPVSLGSPGRSNGTYLNVGSDETPELRAPSSCGRDSEACVGVCECHIGRDTMWTPVTLQCTSKASSRAFRPPPASCSLGGCLAISWRDVLGVQEKKGAQAFCQEIPYSCQDRTHTQRRQVLRFLLVEMKFRAHGGNPASHSPSLVRLSVWTKHSESWPLEVPTVSQPAVSQPVVSQPSLSLVNQVPQLVCQLRVLWLQMPTGRVAGLGWRCGMQWHY